MRVEVSKLDEKTGGRVFKSVHFNIKCRDITDNMIFDIERGVIRRKRKTDDLSPDSDEKDSSGEKNVEEQEDLAASSWDDIRNMVPLVMEALDQIGKDANMVAYHEKKDHMLLKVNSDWLETGGIGLPFI